jgi:hypothetical protein
MLTLAIFTAGAQCVVACSAQSCMIPAQAPQQVSHCHQHKGPSSHKPCPLQGHALAQKDSTPSGKLFANGSELVAITAAIEEPVPDPIASLIGHGIQTSSPPPTFRSSVLRV